jgi:DNA-binding GntR family transcriptional regulator
VATPIGYRTIGDLAYAQLRERILSGALVPGERIDQDAEARRLDASRMPVREAIRRLESEGLVEVIRHHGAVVRPLSVEDLDDLYVLRISLEGVAGRFGTEKLTDDGLAQMRSLLPAMEEIVMREDAQAWLESDWQFHSTLYEAAGHRRLLNIILTLREEVGRYRRIALAEREELEISLKGHREILAACARKDGREVEREIQETLARSHRNLRRIAEQHELVFNSVAV